MGLGGIEQARLFSKVLQFPLDNLYSGQWLPTTSVQQCAIPLESAAFMYIMNSFGQSLRTGYITRCCPGAKALLLEGSLSQAENLNLCPTADLQMRRGSAIRRCASPLGLRRRQA